MKFIRKKYKISPSDLNELNPEETLSDAASPHSKIEMPIHRAVFTVVIFLIAGAFAFYILTIFQLQVVDGSKFAIVARNINSAKYFSVPIRGLIYDDKNRPLVENIPTFSLIGIPNELSHQKKGDLNGTMFQLSTIINLPASSIEDMYLFNKDKPSFEVKGNLTKEEVLRVKDLASKGFYLVYDSTRNHIDSLYSAHFIGYTSKVTTADINQNSYYMFTDRIGRYGLEAQYEDFLRGERQSMLLGGDSVGGNNSKPGNSLYTSIDKDIQEHLYRALLSVGVQRGAAIIQNPKTGEVLGLVSLPSFNSNLFESGGDNGKVQIILDSTTHPLFNRAISGKYSPGSTIKPLLALAGLKEKVVTPDTQINATGSITVRSIYDPSVTYTFNDWRVHGITDIRKAIAWSVDVYFYALGGGYQKIKGLGADKIVQYFKSFLLDQPTGIDLPGEAKGFIPSPDWKQHTRGQPWYIGDTYNISIGQGDLSLTPVALNTYIGSIANGGKLMKPYIVKKIVDSNGTVVQEFSSNVVSSIPFDEDTMKVVREGMRQTITDGTAGLLKDLPVPVAAKTGTAQTSSSTHNGLNSLFTVFGPYDDPTISMTILVENISGGQGMAIKVANTFLSWYFSSEHSR